MKDAYVKQVEMNRHMSNNSNDSNTSNEEYLPQPTLAQNALNIVSSKKNNNDRKNSIDADLQWNFESNEDEVDIFTLDGLNDTTPNLDFGDDWLASGNNWGPVEDLSTLFTDDTSLVDPILSDEKVELIERDMLSPRSISSTKSETSSVKESKETLDEILSKLPEGMKKKQFLHKLIGTITDMFPKAKEVYEKHITESNIATLSNAAPPTLSSTSLGMKIDSNSMNNVPVTARNPLKLERQTSVATMQEKEAALQLMACLLPSIQMSLLLLVAGSALPVAEFTKIEAGLH